MGWNFHSLSTASNLTPYQLWISGVVADRFGNFIGVWDILETDVTESYGIYESGPCPLDDDTVEVSVPEINNPLTEEEVANLTKMVNPLSQSSDYGMDLFIKTACFVADKISNG